jgi:hypothetical protein
VTGERGPSLATHYMGKRTRFSTGKRSAHSAWDRKGSRRKRSRRKGSGTTAHSAILHAVGSLPEGSVCRCTKVQFAHSIKVATIPSWLTPINHNARWFRSLRYVSMRRKFHRQSGAVQWKKQGGRRSKWVQELISG